MAALIQIVDEHDDPVRSATIQEARDSGLWHRIVRVLIFDEAGDVLLQRRGKQNRVYPFCWDASASGHVDDGESFEVAAAREAGEEIGLKGFELEEIDYYQSSMMYDGQIINRFNKTFRTIVPADFEFTLDPGEVAEVKWFSVQEVKALVANHPTEITDGLQLIAERL